MRITLAIVVGIAALLVPGTAVAAPPANDDFANAKAIGSLPYSDVVSNVEATTEGSEINYCGGSNTVWYAFTPSSNAVIRLDPSGTSFFGALLNVYRQDGSGMGGLTHLACSNYGSALTFSPQAGKTYYIRAGSTYWGSGDLHLAISVIPPPANDDIGNATAISGLPYSNTVDVTGATIEQGEPTPSCVGYLQTGTAWYSFTTSQTGSLMATGDYYNTIAAYSGSPGNLTQIGCWNFGHPVTFRANAGTTYYFQLAGIYGNMSVGLRLQEAPPPNAAFGYAPSDPSSFDTIVFYDQSSDPGEVGFSSAVWEFGDGGSATDPGCCPSHRYFADGDYTARLTVTTIDGRTASTTRIVHVRTHDVAVAKMTVPQSASAGQTRSIVVGLSNKRYDEMVRIDLYRSTAAGFVQFASSTQSVPVRGGNKTSDFAFNYAFTSDDAALGKVTFRAVATIVNARDALPSDNETISLPTKVNK
jgi:PKD domain